MRDAGRIRHDDRRASVGFGFLERLEGLESVRAHGDRGDIDVAVAHAHEPEVLLGEMLAAGGEFRHGSARGRLRGLSAGVGVDFGVEDEDVHVAAGGDDVVESAVTDVIGPSVATEDPDGLVHEVILEFLNLLENRLAFGAGVPDRFRKNRLHAATASGPLESQSSIALPRTFLSVSQAFSQARTFSTLSLSVARF